MSFGEGDLHLKSRKLDYALWLACRELARATGSCPYDMHGFDCGCDERCGDLDDMPECWVMYFKEVCDV